MAVKESIVNKAMCVNVNRKTLHKICRLCASDVGPMKAIFQRKSMKTDVGAKIFNCTSIEVSKSEKLSSQICETCDKLVETFHTFKMRCIEVNVELLKLLKKDQTIKQESEIAAEEHFDLNLQLEQPGASSLWNDPTSGKQVDVPVTIEKCKTTRRSSRRLQQNSMHIPLPDQPDDSLNDSSTRNTGGPTGSTTGLVASQRESSTIPAMQQSRNLYSVQQTNLPTYVTIKVEHNGMGTVQADPLDLVLCSYANDSNENNPELLDNLGGEMLINNNVQNYKEKYIESFNMFIKSREVFPVESSSSSREFTGRNIEQNCKNCGKTIASRKRTDRDVCTLCLKQKNARNTIVSLECDICSKVFKSELTLSKHVKCHATRLNRFRCCVCGTKCTSGEILQVHLKRKHGGSTNMTCSLCKSTTKYKSLPALLAHMDKKHDMGASIASSTDEDEDDVDDGHASSCDDVVAEPRKKVARPRKKTEKAKKTIEASLCNYCGKTFGTSTNLSQHIRFTHLAVANFRCEVCADKRFKTPSGLHYHMEAAHGGRKFPCTLCGSLLCSSRGLYSHMRKHARRNTAPSVECPLCPRLFRDKKNVQRHVRSHTGETPFKCAFCPREFTVEWNRRQHECLHTGEKRYVCDKCGKAFTHNVSRKNHMKYHRDEADVETHEEPRL